MEGVGGGGGARGREEGVKTSKNRVKHAVVLFMVWDVDALLLRS